MGKTFPQPNTMCKRYLKSLWIIKNVSKNYPQGGGIRIYVVVSIRLVENDQPKFLAEDLQCPILILRKG